MMKIVNLARKFLMRDVYEFDGFKYQFLDIKTNEDFLDSLSFYVKVILPDPNQSYVSEVFFQQSREIISSLFNFIGKEYSYNLSVQIGDEDKDNLNYIRPAQLEKILFLVNEQFDKVSLDLNDKNYKFDLSFEPSSKRTFYSGDGEDLEFFFDVNLFNLQRDNVDVKIKKGIEGSVAQNLLDVLHDRDWFYGPLEGIIFDIIQPETQIKDYEIYIGIILQIKSIDSVEVKRFGYKEISDDDFISLESFQ